MTQFFLVLLGKAIYEAGEMAWGGKCDCHASLTSKELLMEGQNRLLETVPCLHACAVAWTHPSACMGMCAHTHTRVCTQ